MIEAAQDQAPDATSPAVSATKAEAGATVADARRLARQADAIFIFYHVGPRTGGANASG